MGAQTNPQKLLRTVSAHAIPEADQNALISQCKTWFGSLPQEPNGEVLSQPGAIKAVLAATSHYAQEMALYKVSPKSSKITTQLKDLADTAKQASQCLAEANQHLRQLDKLLSKLGVDAIRRIGVVPSPILRILNESKSAKGGLMLRPYKQALATYGEAELLDLDRHVLRSEIHLFLAAVRGGTYAATQSEDQISQMESLSVVCSAAASLEGVANSKGGAKRAYQEFSLFPSYQLVEGCMAILKAAGLSRGNSKVGLLVDLAMAIRQNVEGTEVDAVTRAIENLPKKASDNVKRLDARISYWAVRLLAEDLKSLPASDAESTRKLAELELLSKELHALLSRKIIPKRVKSASGGRSLLEFGPWKDIDDCSPFR